MKEIYFFDKCFWCLEDFFSNINGVISTQVGYANGHTKNPTYYEVGEGNTGYEEVCKVCYDETVVSLEELTNAFFKKLNPAKIHSDADALLRDNQSAVIFTNAGDAEIILRVKEEIELKYNNKLLTKIVPLSNYYIAEDEHQHYYKKHPDEASCPI